MPSLSVLGFVARQMAFAAYLYSLVLELNDHKPINQQLGQISYPSRISQVHPLKVTIYVHIHHFMSISS